MKRGGNLASWTIEGLAASGPAAGLGSRLRLFGQFVGGWDIVDHRPPIPRRANEGRVGEVHFNWILGGRAVQDVWGHLDAETGRFVPWGTTVRYYSPALRAWRSTWIAPGQRFVRQFVGRKVASEIVLQEEPRGLRTERWIFSDIRPGGFHWRAEKRRRRSGPWETIETMIIKRRES